MGRIGLGALLLLLCAVVRGHAQANDVNPLHGGLNTPHLSHSSVLLPPNVNGQNPSSTEVKGFNGCYTWTAKNPHILSMTVKYTDESKKCSNGVILSSSQPYSGRRSTFVVAREDGTGVTMRCEVFFDLLNRLVMHQTTTTLHLEALADLEIQGFDREGNKFSSLNGMEFKWEAVNRGIEDYTSKLLGYQQRVVLRPVAEDQSRVAVRGTSVGQVSITGACMNCVQKGLKAEVLLTVVESITILPAPSPIKMVSGNPVQLLIELTHASGETAILPSPAPHYTWRSANTNVVRVDAKLGTVSSLKAGSAEVILMDDRVKDDRDSVLVDVVDPSDLQVAVKYEPAGAPESEEEAPKWLMFHKPTDSIYLVVGRSYLMKPTVSDAEGDVLRLTNETAVNMLAPKTPVWSKKRLVGADVKTKGNAGQCKVDMLQEGEVDLQIGIVWYTRTTDRAPLVPQALSTHRKVHACMPLEFVVADGSKVLRLPWVPNVEQMYVGAVTGGCNSPLSRQLLWKQTDGSVATVSAGGTVVARNLGKSSIAALAANDLYYGHNQVALDVAVSYPSSVAKDQAFAVELSLGASKTLFVTYLTAEGEKYHNCTELINAASWTVQGVSIDGEPVLSVQRVPVPVEMAANGVCLAAHVKGIRPGAARVDVSLPTSSGAFLVASYTTTVFTPLCTEPIDLVRGMSMPCAVDWEAMKVPLPVGQPYNLQMRGGPGEVMPGSDLPALVKNTKDKVVVTNTAGQDVTGSDVLITLDAKYRTVELVCMQVGNYTASFEVHGLTINGNKKVKFDVPVYVSCELPSRMVLLAGHMASRGVHSPVEVAAAAMAVADTGGALAGVPTTVMNSAPYLLRAVVLDNNNRPLVNSSIFDFEWSLDHPGVTLTPDEGALDYATMHFNNDVGLIKVRVNLVGMRLHSKTPATMVRVTRSALAAREASLRDTTVLEVVAPLRTLPQNVTMRIGAKAPLRIPISGGSRHVLVDIEDGDIVKAHVKGAFVEIVPKQIGYTNATLRDQITRLTADVNVAVVGVHSVRLVLPQTSCRLNEVVDGVVEVRSQKGEVVNPLQYDELKLKIHQHDTRLQVVALNITSEAAVLRLACGSPGVASFHLTVNNEGAKALRSNAMQLLVYEPVRIVTKDSAPANCPPGNVTMLAGTTRTVSVSGGTTNSEQLFWRFTSRDPYLLHATPNAPCFTGLRPGSTRVEAEALGADGRIYGTDFVTVDIVELRSLRLRLRAHLTVGQEMAATVEPDHDTACIDTMAMSQICHSFKWTVDGPGVLGITSYQSYTDPKLTSPRCGAPANANPGFTTRVSGRKVGAATLKVTVTCGHPNQRSKVFTLERRVTVVDTLPSMLGSSAQTWLLPPKYTTVPVLPTGEAAPAYHIMQDPNALESVLVVDEYGQIITGRVDDVACIRAVPKANTPAHGGPAAVSTCVRIAEVAQITVGGPNLPPHVQEVSVGAMARFQVVMRDATGHPMKVGPSEHGSWAVSNSNPGATQAQMDGDTLTVRTLASGSSLVKLEMEQRPGVFGYVVVQAGDYIKPRTPTVYLGAVLHFQLADALPRDAGKGTWYSGDPRVMRVDPTTGVSAAVGAGATTVHFNGTMLQTYTQVTVRRVMSVEVSRPAGEAYLTNAPLGWTFKPGKAPPPVRYAFPVSFGDANSKPLMPALPPTGSVAAGAGAVATAGHQHIQFECRLVPASLGTARPVSNPVSGMAACEVDLLPPSSGAAGTHEVTMLEVVASIPGAAEDGSAIEGRTAMPYIAGFELAPDTPAVLRMSARRNSSMVEVVGNAAGVEASWDRRDVMMVDVASIKSTREGVGKWLQSAFYGSSCSDSSVGAMFYVGVHPDAPSFTDTVAFVIPQTGQRVTLKVVYAAGVAGTSVSPFSTLMMLLVGMLSVGYIIYTRGESNMPQRMVYAPHAPAHAAAHGGGSADTFQAQSAGNYPPAAQPKYAYEPEDAYASPQQQQYYQQAPKPSKYDSADQYNYR